MPDELKKLSKKIKNTKSLIKLEQHTCHELTLDLKGHLDQKNDLVSKIDVLSQYAEMANSVNSALDDAQRLNPDLAAASASYYRKLAHQKELLENDLVTAKVQVKDSLFNVGYAHKKIEALSRSKSLNELKKIEKISAKHDAQLLEIAQQRIFKND